MITKCEFVAFSSRKKANPTQTKSIEKILNVFTFHSNSNTQYEQKNEDD